MTEVGSRRALTDKENAELPRILFIEDNSDDAEIVRRTLGDGGIAVVEVAETVEDGLRMFRQARWDLLLVDYRLPGSSGLDALDRIRELDPTVPAIMLTGAGDEQVAAAAMKRGADEYLSKDVMTATLPTTVRMLLETRSADERMMALLRENERDEELRKLIEAEHRLLRSLPPRSAAFDGGEPPSAHHDLVSAFARLYRAVAAYSGGLPSAELTDLCRTVGRQRLSSRQILELHTQAADQIIRDEDIDSKDLASRLNEGLLLAILWLNDAWSRVRRRWDAATAATADGPDASRRL
jgi:CheY-like chemotaxis protein